MDLQEGEAAFRMDVPGGEGRTAVRGRRPRHILPPLPLTLVRGNEVGGLDGDLWGAVQVRRALF